MRIIHLSTNETLGGAARAAYRLHRGLIASGAESRVLVLHRQSNDPHVHELAPRRRLSDKLWRFMRRQQIKRSYAPFRSRRPPGFEQFTDSRTQYANYIVPAVSDADIVHLHWTAGFVDIGSFFSEVKVSVVWTLHDMNAFTGGCHYDAGCGRFMTACGACPQLGSNAMDDLSHKVWELKRRTFERFDDEKLHIVTPSRWLAELAQRSPLLGRYTTSVIPYGLDTTVFRPVDTPSVRQALAIPQESQVILFVANSVTNQRKGFDILSEALAQTTASKNLFLLSIGSGKPNFHHAIPQRHLGSIKQDWVLAMVYSAADIFVIPSRQDNLPNTVLESMACGTPVVGFDVGGIPDMVRPGVTGLLAGAGDIHALKDAICALLEQPAVRAEMSINCREVVLKEYNLEQQAREYLELYRSLS